MVDHDEDRPKKSWREIDQKRDGSSHRREPGQSPARQDRLERSAAYRDYKTQLNRVFDGGPLPEALKEKLQEAGVGAQAKERKAAAQTIVEAARPADVLKALQAYREKYGFPEDEPALSRLLDLDDPAVALETVRCIEKLVVEGQLKRTSSLKARIRTAMMTLDDPELNEVGKRVIDLL